MTQNSPSQYSCIFFDFDGVIADSVEAKITSFGELYDEFGPDVRRAVEDYQRAVPGETRYVKIPKFHRELLGVDLPEHKVLEWSNRLSEIVLDEVVACPLLPGVNEVLAQLAQREVQAHIVSGTPHDELQVIIERMGLKPFFKTARGSPEKKASIVRDIMTAEGLEAEQCLFVGDAMSDYDGAKTCQIAFLGRSAQATNPFPAGTAVVEHLGEYFLSDNAPVTAEATGTKRVA